MVGERNKKLETRNSKANLLQLELGDKTQIRDLLNLKAYALGFLCHKNWYSAKEIRLVGREET